MEKAIKELQKYKDDILHEAGINGYFPYTDDVDSAIAELTAHKAKIDELEKYCQEVITGRHGLASDAYKIAHLHLKKKLEEL